MLLSAKEVAFMIGYTYQGFLSNYRKMIAERNFPKPITLTNGGRPRWKQAEIEEFLR